MEEVVLHHGHALMYMVAEYVIFSFEVVGILILIFSGICGVINCLKRDAETGLKLSEGMSMALQFLLGGEILKTVVVADMESLLHVGGIVVLRVALTLLTHWELKNHKQELEEHHKEEEHK